MKKIYAIALMALAGVTTANAQALKLDKNYVIYTDHNGKDNLEDVLGGIFLDDEYTTFPVTGGNLSTTTHKLTKDYNDPETGVTIKAGEYNFISSSTEIKFKDAYNKQGLKNIKKVIAYIGGIGSNTTYTRMTQKDADGENYVHYEGDPTNRAWSYYCAPNLEMGPKPDGDKLDDSYLTYSSPIKLTVDLTNSQDGTEDEISGAKFYINCNSKSYFQGTSGTWYCTYEETEQGNPVTENRMLLQFYEQAQGVDSKGEPVIVQGEKLIPWSAENRYSIAFKKGAYIMALAFICADENAETVYANIKDGTNDWTSGISSITTNEPSAKNGAIYNLAGQRISTPVSGQLYIQDGKKYIKK